MIVPLSAFWNSLRPTSETRTRAGPTAALWEFLAWCDEQGVPPAAAVEPRHVAAWIEQQTREYAAPTAKLRLAALRHLFDWLVTGQVMPVNPAGSVRGPSHVVKAGKTPVLAPEEARALIEQTIGKLKRYKRVAMRCEKTDTSYAAFISFACGLMLVKSVHTA